MHFVRALLNLLTSKKIILFTGPRCYCRRRSRCNEPGTLQEPVFHPYTAQSDLALIKFGSSLCPIKLYESRAKILDNSLTARGPSRRRRPSVSGFAVVSSSRLFRRPRRSHTVGLSCVRRSLPSRHIAAAPDRRAVLPRRSCWTLFVYSFPGLLNLCCLVYLSLLLLYCTDFVWLIIIFALKTLKLKNIVILVLQQ